MSEKQYTTIYGDVAYTTDKAVWFYLPDAVDDDDGTWIPRSLIEDGDQVEEDEDVDLNVETWFCEKEGLI